MLEDLSNNTLQSERTQLCTRLRLVEGLLHITPCYARVRISNVFFDVLLRYLVINIHIFNFIIMADLSAFLLSFSLFLLIFFLIRLLHDLNHCHQSLRIFFSFFLAFLIIFCYLLLFFLNDPLFLRILLVSVLFLHSFKI